MALHEAIARSPAAAARTRLLLEGPIVSTVLRLAVPNLVVNVVLIAVIASVAAHFVGRLGHGSRDGGGRWHELA